MSLYFPKNFHKIVNKSHCVSIYLGRKNNSNICCPLTTYHLLCTRHLSKGDTGIKPLILLTTLNNRSRSKPSRMYIYYKQAEILS